ncbi:hypothetical protein C1646_768767 [Rhizophagus diaphanus]|nr:hypothetical protein C1646_768767 [Rhizophagus diaphanus] [Rhizophagus sp. MUCL 43196]
MRDFLNRINIDNILSPLQNNDDMMHMLKSQLKDTLVLTGKDLIKRNVENEVHRLRSHNDIIDIDSATNIIWNSHLTNSQRERLMRLAYNITNNRNSETIGRMSQINIPQITNSSFEDNFFNGYGTNFYEEESFQSLILPNGFLALRYFLKYQISDVFNCYTNCSSRNY